MPSIRMLCLSTIEIEFELLSILPDILTVKIEGSRGNKKLPPQEGILRPGRTSWERLSSRRIWPWI